MVIFQETDPAIEKMAFIGVRACEIEAIFVQDKVFNNKIAVYQAVSRAERKSLPHGRQLHKVC